MNKVIACLLLLTLSTFANAEDLGVLIEQMDYAAARADFLGVRVLARRALTNPVNLTQWLRAREILHRNPAVGWDLLWKFDRTRLDATRSIAEQEVNRRWLEADSLMSQGKFKKASVQYVSVLRTVQKDPMVFGHSNFFSQQNLMHSLARALYGEGRFKDSLKIYQRITLLYPFVRQIQFEKMWAAFRAANYSVALGATASQLSSYFNRFMEPESYLVQYYLYRRMCRKADMEQVSANVLKFKKALDENKFTIEDWAAGDLETKILLHLAQANPEDGATGYASVEERRTESGKIMARLQQRYAADVKRIQSQLVKVIAYLNMASVAAKSALPAISPKTNLKTILNTQSEMWPLEDSEDWLDEIGRHYFVGQSECK